MPSTLSSTIEKKNIALVCGIGGQDGAYLTKLLCDKGYSVVGTSRDATGLNRGNLAALGVDDAVKIVSMASSDFRSVLQTVVKVAPDEIYNLAGQTSVGLSFEQPVETIESIAIGVLNLLEAIRFVDRPVKLYHAGSSECFGDTGEVAATENTPFSPRSPYAVAKACAHNLVANYRDAYRLFACTGILFNHESPLRPERFVTQKIVRGAARIARGEQQELVLGNLKIDRDWGWAPEYVEVMWRMLQQDVPQDFVIATGRTVSLEYFVDRAFHNFGLNWQRHVLVDNSLFRPSDIRHGAGNPALAAAVLRWSAKHDVDSVIDEMCKAADGRL